MSEEILASVRASAPRRGFGVAVLAGLGVLVIYFTFARPPGNIGLQLFLFAMGLGALWLAVRMWRATQLVLELTGEVLRTGDGTVLARVEDIEAVDRGIFAFKPSNGFMLRLRESAAAGWQPGMYWRLGRRLGVGGVTPAAQTKIMADAILVMLARRQPQ